MRQYRIREEVYKNGSVFYPEILTNTWHNLGKSETTCSVHTIKCKTYEQALEHINKFKTHEDNYVEEIIHYIKD